MNQVTTTRLVGACVNCEGAWGFPTSTSGDYLTRHILLRCDSSSDLYPVTKPSTSPIAFLSTSASTWNQRLGHPGDQGSQVAYLLIYVDDINVKASSPALLHQIIDSLHNDFDMIDLGALNYFLGISADCNSTGLFLSQRKYALQLLERAHMVHCNPSRTPVNIESKLGPEGVPVQDPTLYRSLAGGLQYLTFTRPDLSYVIQQLYASDTTSLVGYTDADWAAKRQHTRSRSSAKVEYCGVANVVTETAWLRNLLRELHFPLSTATLVYFDNVSSVYMSDNPVQHKRTKHIEFDIHFVRDMVTAGEVRVLHVPSRYQYLDIFTKGLPSALFEEFRSSLSVHPLPAQTARAY
ncbi:ribonuclease H-like domain-containing protein [Tanacetum coccineum]